MGLSCASQAQAKLGLPAEAEVILTVEFMLAFLKKAYYCYQMYL